jgi:hypothetical protein
MEQNNWGAELWRQPDSLEGDTVLFSECGRITNGVDFRSHWFKLVQPQYGPYALLVKHGGGVERIPLGYGYIMNATLDALTQASSDARYVMLHCLFNIHQAARRRAQEETAARYEAAFLDGRLKRRKRHNHYYCELLLRASTENLHKGGFRI